MYGKARKTKTQMLRDIGDAHPGAVICFANKDPSKRNTIKYGIRDGDLIRQILRYQDTDIIFWNVDGSITLDSGGWRTSTTKSRFNEHLIGASVWQQKGVWLLNVGGNIHEYYDGIVINPDGSVVSVDTVESDRVKDLTKRINAFCKLVTLPLPQPSAGDCFLCMFEKDSAHAMDGYKNDHILSHFEEGYVHGTLLCNAMRWAGYQDQQIAVHYSMNLDDTFKRTLRRYLKRRFQIGT